jgi:hypothetical protein
MMKRIPTYYNDNYSGMKTMKEICILKEKAQVIALRKQRGEKADHMVYGLYEYDNKGDINVVNIYDGIAKTESDFDRIATRRHTQIYAIHNHR